MHSWPIFASSRPAPVVVFFLPTLHRLHNLQHVIRHEDRIQRILERSIDHKPVHRRVSVWYRIRFDLPALIFIPY
jgi:hypothetical protein